MATGLVGQTRTEAFTVRCVDDMAGLEALCAAWRELHDQDPEASVFVSWEWLHAWWKHYGKGQPLRVLAAYQGHQLVGILPLYIQRIRVFRAVAVRVLRLVGTGGDTSPDYLGPILRPDLATSVTTALLGHVFDELHDWDVLCLSDLAERLCLRQVLEEQCARRGLQVRLAVAEEIWYENLPGSWDDYMAGLSQHRRRHVRSSRRKLEQEYGAQFFLVQDGQALEGTLERLSALHQSRFDAKGVQHSFSSPEYVGFHRDAVRACGQRGWIAFYGVEVGGKAKALFYCYKRRGEIFVYQSGMDPNFSRQRPGLALAGYMFEHAIAQGDKVIDFLRGDYHFKRQWCKQMRNTFTLTAYQRTARVALYRLRTAHLPRLKAWIVQHGSSRFVAAGPHHPAARETFAGEDHSDGSPPG